MVPYVPSEKTDGESNDRRVIGYAIDPKTKERIDGALEPLAQQVASAITNNFSLCGVYVNVFTSVVGKLDKLLSGKYDLVSGGKEFEFAKAIYNMGDKYGYEGAFLGELNYGFTMFIQRVPEIKVERGDWNEELRYWLYAVTAESLLIASQRTLHLGIGVGGVFDDILREYKDKVNAAYEVEQIVKSGHCYFTPYYKRPVELIDEAGNHIGFMDVMLKRSDETVYEDVLKGQLILKGTKPIDLKKLKKRGIRNK
jgi:hypothetical protein